MKRVAVQCLALAMAIAMAHPTAAYARNACDDGGSATPGSGIGGTGHSDPGGINGTGQADPSSGIGGTGRTDDPGIGGTGRDPGEGGIGGTGRARAIIGTVTGYASLCVAGIEVEVDQAALAGSGSSELPAIGETVEIVAVGRGNSVHALSVARRPIVVGNIAAIDAGSSTLHVHGQKIVFDSSTRSRAKDGSDAAFNAATMIPGANVQVSGWRHPDGRIEATRIDDAGAEPALVSGTVTRNENGVLDVGGTTVDASTLAARDVKVGDQVTVVGRAEGDRLVASRIARPIANLLERGVTRLDVDSVVGADGRVAIGTIRLPVPAGERVGVGARVRVSADIARDGMVRLDAMRPAIPPRRPDFGRRAPAFAPGRFGGHPMGPPPRFDRPERPPFPNGPPPRPPRMDRPPPPPPPRIMLPERR